MKEHRLGRLLTFLVTVAVASLGLVTLGACKPCPPAAITADGMLAGLRTDDGDNTSWQKWLKGGPDRPQAGKKDPKKSEPDGGVKGKGGSGGGQAKPKDCGGSGKAGGSKKDAKFNGKLFGANGQQYGFSKPVANGTAGRTPWRIDLENPRPGYSPASLHVQLNDKTGATRYEYSGSGKFKTKDGDPLPRKVQNDIDKDPKAQKKIREALDTLKEKW